MLRVRTTLEGWQGAPGLQTFYFTGGAEDAAEALTCVVGVHSFWDDWASDMVADQVTIDVQSSVDKIDAVTGQITDTFSVAAQATINGGGGVAMAPPATAALVHLRTSNYVAGRRVQGKIFISPLGAGILSADGTLSAGFVTTAPAGMTALAADVASVGSVVVWHRPKNGAGGLSCPITSTDSPTKLAVLTSRRD